MKNSEKQGFQILVVDDEPTVSRAIKMLLEHDGHKVQTVDGGVAALALLEQNQFDLIVTDFSMPGMKGDQLVALIKQRRPDQPVIMATAFAKEFEVFGRLSGKVDFLLNKPFSMEDLREAVAQVMAGKNSNQNSGSNIIPAEPTTGKLIPPQKP
jgi:CheY-like chemotaxis protein